MFHFWASLYTLQSRVKVKDRDTLNFEQYLISDRIDQQAWAFRIMASLNSKRTARCAVDSRYAKVSEMHRRGDKVIGYKCTGDEGV